MKTIKVKDFTGKVVSLTILEEVKKAYDKQGANTLDFTGVTIPSNMHNTIAKFVLDMGAQVVALPSRADETKIMHQVSFIGREKYKSKQDFVKAFMRRFAPGKICVLYREYPVSYVVKKSASSQRKVVIIEKIDIQKDLVRVREYHQSVIKREVMQKVGVHSRKAYVINNLSMTDLYNGVYFIETPNDNQLRVIKDVFGSDRIKL